MFVLGDITRKEDVERVFELHSIDAVFHFAGLKAVWESCEQPFSYYFNNVVGTLNLLKCMDAHGVRDIVFSSSATVYDGHQTSAPYTEESPLWTHNPYGSTKLIIEQLLSDMSEQKNFRSISLRYFNPIWAHPSGVIGESPTWTPNNLLPYLMEVASGKRATLTIFWNDFDTPDGTWIRDYIHVVDLVEAHRVAYTHLLKQKVGYDDVFNLGTGNGTSVFEMVNMTQELTGTQIRYTVWDRRPWDGDIITCDPSKAERVLDWKATRSIQEAIRDAWRFVNK